jgi:hypothetical protein
MMDDGAVALALHAMWLCGCAAAARLRCGCGSCGAVGRPRFAHYCSRLVSLGIPGRTILRAVLSDRRTLSVGIHLVLCLVRARTA